LKSKPANYQYFLTSPVKKKELISQKIKATVKPNGDAIVYVRRSETLSARCEVAAKYANKSNLPFTGRKEQEVAAMRQARNLRCVQRAHAQIAYGAHSV